MGIRWKMLHRPIKECSEGAASLCPWRRPAGADHAVALACPAAPIFAFRAGPSAERRRPTAWKVACVVHTAEVLCGNLSGDGGFRERTTRKVGRSWRRRLRGMPKSGFHDGRSLRGVDCGGRPSNSLRGKAKNNQQSRSALETAQKQAKGDCTRMHQPRRCTQWRPR